MARGGGFDVDIDVRSVEGLVERLNELGGERLGDIALRTVNQVVDEVYSLVVPRLSQRVNLPVDYIQTRMSVQKGSNPNAPAASVVASGSKPNVTTLARYAPRQLVQAAKRPKNSKGDARAGIKIAPGMKSAGISVEVTRGSRKSITNGFYMPLKNGNGLGVFTRTGPGKKAYRHRYGPSVYQMFKSEAIESAPDAADMLTERLLDNVESEIKKVLS
jgi:hypothetical protein